MTILYVKLKPIDAKLGKRLDDYVSRPYSIAFLLNGIYLSAGTDSMPVFNIIEPPLLIPRQEINHEIVHNKYYFYFGTPTISILILGTNAVRELEQLF